MVNNLSFFEKNCTKTGFYNVHTHSIKQNPEVLNIFNMDPSVSCSIPEGISFFTAGIHPWRASDEEKVKNYTIFQNPQLLGIGETGIDRVYPKNLKTQRRLFIEHIELSEKLDKPMIIHCVKSASDIAEIRKETGALQRWLIHGFNGKRGAFDLLKNKGFYFSFGKDLQKGKSNQKSHLKKTPLNRILLETDDSSITIHEIYKTAAEISGLDIFELRGIIRDNFYNFFGVESVSKLAGKN